jgi:hypothetical protein
MPSADLTPAWIHFQIIAPPWFNACERSRVRNTLFRRSFVGVAGLPASVAISARNRVNSSQCRHCSQRMNHTAILAPSRAAVLLPSPSGFSPSYRGLVPECWRNVIVAGRCRKSSASFVGGSLCQLRHQFAGHMATSMCLCRPDLPGRKSALNCRLCGLPGSNWQQISRRQKTRHRGPANAAQRRRRGDRVRQICAVHECQERKLPGGWKSANFRPCLRRFREPDNDATPHVLSTD